MRNKSCLQVLNDPATTNEDALRILACSKQATNVTTTNALGVLGGAIRASNMRQSNMNLRKYFQNFMQMPFFTCMKLNIFTRFLQVLKFL